MNQRMGELFMGMEYETAKAVMEEVARVVTGKDDCIKKAFAAILAGGHILIEDVPGVGKTTLAVGISQALALSYKRVQFTPDVLPSDILGFSMYQSNTGEFEFRPGSVFCNLFLADEINRTSPKTQSALIEDVPGVGKTTLAVAFSKVMGLENHRVQFTPDVLPADILGFNMYRKETGDFVYYPGTIMCNLFLADEINRTSPKTQSALLEVMEEGKVTVDGVSREVPKPFIVMATQNPKGSAGTQLLPESQLDRFMICMSMGYPDVKSEIAIARGRSSSANMVELQPVIGAQELEALCGIVEDVYMSESIYTYIVALVGKTRENSYIELGVSPRGTIACVRMAKAWAFLQGRNYVMPEDVADIFIDIVKHRIVLNTKARVTHMTEEAILSEILSVTKQPASYMEKSEYRG